MLNNITRRDIVGDVLTLEARKMKLITLMQSCLKRARIFLSKTLWNTLKMN